MHAERRHGFTLIELLIVVAIIAILAAIAVPNFLEAQIRSKVSRVRSDMRSLATAIEAYRIDENGYMPYSAWGSHTDPVYLNALSTPVAYMTAASTIVDPFWSSRDRTVDRTFPRYGYFTRWITPAGGGAPTLQPHAATGMSQGILPATVQWFLVSVGPDKYQNADSANPGSVGIQGPQGFILYDATNGTRSIGDIYRWGP
ncbi:MAG TPA: prepilin-type N-terminal cleavage/methylation domain-containing protein [Phycisphaerae bacterium]|nr:prepilin-type N-terminal cleavage/methylation domain-containing protein [Phycisphaerae bacterium]